MVSDYRLFLVSTMIIAAIAVLGLNLLTGFNGQFSLGHGAFYAVGAYTAAILMDKLNVPYWATMPAAAIVCFIVGYLFGLPALKLEGHYLALATFALALAVPQILKYKWLEGLTGGVQGIVLMKPEVPFGLPLTEDQWLYYFCLLVMVVLFWARRQHAEQPQRPRHDGDPRPVHGGRHDGHRHRALQDRHLRHQRRLYRHRRRAVGLGHRLRGARQLQHLPVDQVPDRPGGGRHRLADGLGGRRHLLRAGRQLGAGAVDQFVKNDLGLQFDLSAYTVFGILLIVLMYLMPMGIVGGVYFLVQSCAAGMRGARRQPAGGQKQRRPASGSRPGIRANSPCSG